MQIKKTKKASHGMDVSCGIFASFVSKTRDWIGNGGGFKSTSTSDPFFAWLSGWWSNGWRFDVCFGVPDLLYPTKIPG